MYVVKSISDIRFSNLREYLAYLSTDVAFWDAGTSVTTNAPRTRERAANPA
jgi:hypothetical protein